LFFSPLKDVNTSLPIKTRLDNPLSESDPINRNLPEYPSPKAQQIAAADRDQHHSFTPTTILSPRRQGSTFLAMKARNGIGAARWVVVPVIAIDIVCTLLGQPSSYWRHPASGIEANPFFAWFLCRGQGFFISWSICYIAGVVLATWILPRRLATVALLSFILGHFFGASTWLLFRFGLGIAAPVIYGIAIASLLVSLGLNFERT